MTRLEAKKDEIINKQFGSLIRNWNDISYKDKQKILSYLDENVSNAPNNSKEKGKKASNNLVENEEKVEILVTKKNKEGKVTVDFAKLKESYISPEISTHLSKTLRGQEQSAVLEYSDQFSRILLYEGGTAENIRKFKQEEKCQDPKQELLTAVSLALEEATKKANINTSITSQIGVKKHEFMMGEKTQKFIGSVVEIGGQNKRNEGIGWTKNSLRQKGILSVAVCKQKVKLLEDIQQYLQKDKSLEFNFDEYNKSISIIYDYHRNEVELLSTSHEHQTAQKKLNNITYETPKEKVKN